MSIHHAVTKKADKFGVKISEPEHGYFVVEKDGKVVKEGPRASEVLDAALQELGLTKAPKPRAPKTDKPKPNRKARRKAKAKGEDGDEEGDEGGGKSVITAKYKKKYKPNKDTCGDPFIGPVFEFLHPDGEDVDVTRLVKLGKDNGIDTMDRWGHLKNKQDGLNVGMVRMNLVNVLRGMVRQGKDVKIGGTTIKGEAKE